MKKKFTRKVPFLLEYLLHLLEGVNAFNFDDFPEVEKAYRDFEGVVWRSILSYFPDFNEEFISSEKVSSSVSFVIDDDEV